MPRRDPKIPKTRHPRVRFHKDGHVTISGLTSQDANSLLTMTSLYWYDDQRKREAQSEEKKKDRGADDPCNIAYHRRMRFIIDALEKHWKDRHEAGNRDNELSRLKRELGRQPTARDILKHDLQERKKHRLEMDYIMGRAAAPDEEQPPLIVVTKPIPAFGAIIEYGLDSFGQKPERYRVTGWMKTQPPLTTKNPFARMLYSTEQKIDGRRLMWCVKEEAEYVCGAGIAGCVAPVNEIKIVGMVQWDEKFLKEQEESFLKGFVGQALR